MHDVPTYRREDVPPHLLTGQQLRDRGRPVGDLAQPAGYLLVELFDTRTLPKLSAARKTSPIGARPSNGPGRCSPTRRPSWSASPALQIPAGSSRSRLYGRRVVYWDTAADRLGAGGTRWQDAMPQHAAWVGEPAADGEGYRTHELDGDHGALATATPC